MTDHLNDTYVMRLMSLQHVKDETDVQRQKRILSELLEDIQSDIRRLFDMNSNEQRRRDWDLKL